MEQGEAIYFDGQSNRKRKAVIRLGPALEIVADGVMAAAWSYGDVRRMDSAPGLLRLMCASASAPALARIEIQDEALKQAVEAHCPALEGTNAGASQSWRIAAYSAAALASFVGLLVYGIPLLADRLAMIVPAGIERRLGEAVDQQVSYILGGKICEEPAGRAALNRLVDRLQGAAQLTVPFDVQVLATPLPNAVALPGGKVYVSNGLLQKATTPDELAGVIAHELGHLQHRDSLRRLIRDGGTGFMIGMLFGDVLGGGAILFATRSLLSDSYSRDDERGADAFSIDVMRKLARSPKAMGDLLMRITGTQSDKMLTILSSHPLTEERLETMAKAEQAGNGAELIPANEWKALQGICR